MKTKLSSFLLSSLLILSGCARYPLKNRSLSQLPKEHTFKSTDSTITGAYTILNAKRCNQYLGRNVEDKGYLPIYITVTNNSPQALSFALENISLPTTPAPIVAKSVHKSIAGRAIGLGIPAGGGLYACASVIAPAFDVTNPGSFFLFVILIIPVTLLACACIIPPIVVSTNAKKYNDELDRVFASTAIKKHLYPQCTLSGLIFVPKKQFNKNFTVTLVDDASSRKVVLTS